MSPTADCPKPSVRLAVVNPTAGGLSGGYRKYLHSLLPQLIETSRFAGIRVYVPPTAHDALRAIPDLELESISSGWRGTQLSSTVNAWRPDVVFVPTARWMRGVLAPQVTMVRNMEPFVAGCEGHRPLSCLRNAARASVARWSCLRAASVIGVSQYVSEYLSTTMGLPTSRVHTIYHGVDAPPINAEMPNCVAPLLGRPFLFTAGSIRPARGLDDLVEALGDLAGTPWALPLVVAGAADPDTRRYAVEVRRRARRTGIDVVWCGTLLSSEMSWCFQHALAFVMTSRAEACPNVALEAMAAGARIISTDQAPMPEFFGKAAVYYTRRSSASLLVRLKELHHNSGKLLSAASAAHERSLMFSWSRTAHQTANILLDVAHTDSDLTA